MTIDTLTLEHIITQAQQLSPEDRLRLIQRLAETLISTIQPKSPRYLIYGEFKGERMSTEEDFLIAEWHPTVELEERSPVIAVQYDDQADILTFSFTRTPQPAEAEEAADEIWVSYHPETHQVISVEVLNFSARVRATFGPALTYTERTDPQRLEVLPGLPLPTDE